MKVGRGGTEIVFPGEARAVETDVDRPRFSTRLAAASIDPEQEAAVLGMLAGGRGATPGARRKVRRRGGTRRAEEQPPSANWSKRRAELPRPPDPRRA